MTMMSTMGRGGKRPGAGRPKKDPEDVRSHQVGLRFSPREESRYQDAAGASGKDLLDWIHEVLAIAAAKVLGRK